MREDDNTGRLCPRCPEVCTCMLTASWGKWVQVREVLTGEVIDAVRAKRPAPYFITDEVYNMSIDFILAMHHLGRCLRDAGALCEAWQLGHAYGYQACPCGGYLPGDEEAREEEERILRLYFRPGHALPDSKGKG